MRQTVYLRQFLIMFILLTATSFTLYGQTGYQEFFNRSLEINNTGMLVLGSWAVGNIAVGTYGWIRNEGDRKYFNQMNLFWNLINVTIAGFALHGNSGTDITALSDSEIISKHLQTEKILLINSGLDIGYIGAGYLMRHFSGSSKNRTDLLRGYGNSVMLQGTFLLVFDTVLYLILWDHRISFPVDLQAGFISGSLVPGIRFTF